MDGHTKFNVCVLASVVVVACGWRDGVGAVDWPGWSSYPSFCRVVDRGARGPGSWVRSLVVRENPERCWRSRIDLADQRPTGPGSPTAPHSASRRGYSASRRPVTAHAVGPREDPADCASWPITRPHSRHPSGSCTHIYISIYTSSHALSHSHQITLILVI